jgi:metal-dependent HD superfamily phosphatase/phosphodiesterase
MHPWIRLVGIFAVALSVGAAVPLFAADAETELAAIERQRFAAMLAADVAALDRILAPDLTYTHSNAKLETKQEFIEAIKTGALKYRAITPEEIRVRVYGSTAVLTGRCRFEVTSGGQDLKVLVRFTDVYVNRDRPWQMVAWQSTRIAEP